MPSACWGLCAVLGSLVRTEGLEGCFQIVPALQRPQAIHFYVAAVGAGGKGVGIFLEKETPRCLWLVRRVIW
jgi:hypothetical protein